jgi:hypothetical protein
VDRAGLRGWLVASHGRFAGAMWMNAKLAKPLRVVKRCREIQTLGRTLALRDACLRRAGRI